MATKQVQNKTYIVERAKETIKVTVPATWKVTFGPGVPDKRNHFEQSGWCLRFYETKEQQRAIFTDVRSFRDTSIEVIKKVVETELKLNAKENSKGSKIDREEKREEKWEMVEF